MKNTDASSTPDADDASAEPPSAVHHVRFSADGQHALGYTQQGWQKWPVGGGLLSPISDASSVSDENMVHVSRDGRMAADLLHEPGFGRNKGKSRLRITDFTTGKTRTIDFDGGAWNLVMSPDGRFVSACLNGSEYVTWDALSGEVTMRQKRSANDRIILLT